MHKAQEVMESDKPAKVKWRDRACRNKKFTLLSDLHDKVEQQSELVYLAYSM